MIPDVWRPGLAKKIPAGSDLILQMHYTVNGKKAVKDRTRVGLIFSKEAPAKRVLTLGAMNTMFEIPPGDANYRVDGEAPHVNQGQLLSFFPHMHLRGKAFEYRLVQPTGEKQTLFVSRIMTSTGSFPTDGEAHRPASRLEIEATAWFDNSPNNPANPDPKATVRWGEQSREEMMVGFYDVAVDAKYDRRSYYQQPKKRSSD